MQPFATLSVGGGYLFVTVPYIYSLSVAPGTQTLLGAILLGWVSTLTYSREPRQKRPTGIGLSCDDRELASMFLYTTVRSRREFNPALKLFRGPWPKQTANRLSALGMRLYLQMGTFALSRGSFVGCQSRDAGHITV